MSAGLQAVALLTPVVTTNAIFSARRASKGIDALDDNPVYGAMNIDIAGGQVLKGSRAAMSFNPAIEEGVHASFKGLTEGSKLVKGVSKVLNVTADYINPVICLTSGVKVMSSEDKIDTAAREALSLTTMFAAEGAAKRILGMPMTKMVNGKTLSVQREALPFIEKQLGALNDYCATKKLFNKIPLKGVPGIIKGLGFVLASIYGYKLGSWAADKILGETSAEVA